MWFAGAGVQPGTILGESDEMVSTVWAGATLCVTFAPPFCHDWPSTRIAFGTSTMGRGEKLTDFGGAVIQEMPA